MLPGLQKSYLSEDETGGCGAAIRPLESTPPRIGSSIHLKKERMFSVVVIRKEEKKVPARGPSWNSCLSVDGPINQHPSSCEKQLLHHCPPPPHPTLPTPFHSSPLPLLFQIYLQSLSQGSPINYLPLIRPIFWSSLQS